jgi:APA family basic amino acid/polyamine antiporter
MSCRGGDYLFAYIGFDSVSTHAEEAKNPSRDVPIGIIASLIVCTILYIGVVAVLTGMVSYKDIDKNAGVSSAFKEAAKVEGISPLMKSILLSSEVIIACRSVAGIHVRATGNDAFRTSGSPWRWLGDGLVPKAFFADVHPTFKTPWLSTIGIGIFVMILAGLAAD